MQIVIDTNILIAALNIDDCRHAEVKQLVNLLRQGSYEILAPALVLWEFYAYNDHPEKSRIHNQDVDIAIQFTSIPVTQELFANTYTRALVGVTGADRVFISVAKEFNVPIITNDKTILNKASQLGVQAISASNFIHQAADN